MARLMQSGTPTITPVLSNRVPYDSSEHLRQQCFHQTVTPGFSVPPPHQLPAGKKIIAAISNPTTTLTAETVEGTALALERVNNVERSDGLALRVLGVSDSVADDTLEESLQDTTRLLVDHWAGESVQRSCECRRHDE